MRRPKTPAAFREQRSDDPEYLRWVRNLWRARARTAEYQAEHPPHRGAWLCIHRYERNPTQGWRTRTGNGYYGGLQMDIGFQRQYGAELLRRKGTADRWTPVEQMWVAERAHRSGRGFYPVAEHGSLLRPDLGRRFVFFAVRAVRAPLAQPDGEEDRGDA